METTTQEFSCKNDGCTMTFTCEDQLVAHEKRHEMVLNLGPLKANLFNSDQTPTPTRFIRNCDEVGLFQDLQNVNPFEETFRRAVEQNKNGGPVYLATPSSNALNDDTLHTPHIFPNFNNAGENSFLMIDEQSSTNSQTNQSAQQPSTSADSSSLKSVSTNVPDDKRLNTIKQSSLSDNTTIAPDSNLKDLNNSQLVLLADNNVVSKETPQIPKVNHVINLSSGNSVLLPVLEQIHISEEVAEQLIANNSIALQNHTPSNDISNVKKQLKASILKNTQQSVVNTSLLNTASAITSVPSVSSVVATNDSSTFGISGLRNILPKHVSELKRPLNDKKSPIKSKVKTSKVKDVQKKEKTKVEVPQKVNINNDKTQKSKNDDLQRKQFLERNRAAASRWRVKKREQIRELIRRNHQLEQENTTLKSECAELKKMLLTHKNCTLAVPPSFISGPVTELNSITPLGIQSSAINAINKIAIRNNVHNINVSLNT
ncbi:cyclic AMP-responsive element-binding protein 5-like [Ctenocephalides felis]|uniref:cyclic AMP-responsive element-binding protein 5-like n=1 Tax=Ctenocephalides felis TaxID=7515 RepID=UPI000E6E15F4|nr:cyclic AMP-responsive element-binding protein 5-like [Ctenocephalides felis]